MVSRKFCGASRFCCNWRHACDIMNSSIGSLQPTKGTRWLCPFPGMDPYLEGSLWTNFHTQFSVEIARQFAPRLRPKYLALTEKRFVLAMAEEEDGLAISAVDVRTDVARRPL